MAAEGRKMEASSLVDFPVLISALVPALVPALVQTNKYLWNFLNLISWILN